MIVAPGSPITFRIKNEKMEDISTVNSIQTAITKDQ